MVVIESLAAGVAITATTHHYAKPYTVHSQLSTGAQFLEQTLEELEKYGKNYEPSSRETVSDTYNKSVFPIVIEFKLNMPRSTQAGERRKSTWEK